MAHGVVSVCKLYACDAFKLVQGDFFLYDGVRSRLENNDASWLYWTVRSLPDKAVNTHPLAWLCDLFL